MPATRSLAPDVLQNWTCFQERRNRESVMPCLSSAGNVLRGHPRLHLPPGERREANKTQEANETLQCDPHKRSGELRKLAQEELTVLFWEY